MFNCSCCGTDITSPYFYDGGVYGWTCIKKVNPRARRNKPKSKFVEVIIRKVEFGENSGRGMAYVTIDGVNEIRTAYRDYEDGAFSDSFEMNNCSFYDGKYWTSIGA